METEGSLLCLKRPFIKITEHSSSNPLIYNFFKIHFSIIPQLRRGLPTGPFPLDFEAKVYENFSLPHACNMPYPSHSPDSDTLMRGLFNKLLGLQMIMLLIGPL
jgi:hypothetical protein